MEMSANEFIEEMKKIQTNLLDFLDHCDHNEENFQNLINIFDDIKIHDDQFKIKPLLYLIVKVSNNHHREFGFFSKIEKILQLFKDDMKKYFTNYEIFHIFRSNKRLLLFLLEENIMIIDKPIVKKFFHYNKTIKNKYMEAKYPEYFRPEIQSFFNEKWFLKYNQRNFMSHHSKDLWLKTLSNKGVDDLEKQLPDDWIDDLKKGLPSDFYEKRKIGENDDEICKLIQKDLIDEFITYVNKNCYPVNSTIKPSIYETNKLLLKQWKCLCELKTTSLIEYAAFFGSIQIFNYLRQNGAELKSSLWIYAVHGQNPEIISFLEENKILPKTEEESQEMSFKLIFKESIKCHHIDVAYYIQDNYLHNEKEYSNDALINYLKYYNFMFLGCEIENETSFYYLCKYDYYLLVFILLKKIDIDINKIVVYTMIY